MAHPCAMPDLMPTQLADIIATHRALFGGFTMMADGETPPPATEPPAAPAPPAPVVVEPDNYSGAGGKDALKADLAVERDKRQALETQFSQLRDGLAKALGIEADKATPEQLTEQLAAAKGETAAVQTQLAVFLAAPDGVDVKALLDSSSFRASLSKINASDQAAITAAITTFVDSNPRFRTTPSSGGDLSAGHGRAPVTTAPGVPRMAAALEQQLTKN